MTETQEKAPAIDWSSFDAPTETAQLKPSKTLEDIPPQIREWIEQADANRTKVYSQPFPNATVAKVFLREARDYCFMRSPRVTLRASVQKDGKTVNYRVEDYVSPEDRKAAAEAAKGSKGK